MRLCLEGAGTGALTDGITGLIFALNADGFDPITLIALLLASCANPHRFDPLRQQQLQHQQDECLAKGGNPRDCRP
jgi:hypothetical protein